MTASELVDFVTKPVISHIFSRFKPKKLDELALDLKIAKWDKFFTPIQYKAINCLLKIIGIIVFILISFKSVYVAAAWSVILFFGMGFLLKNSIKNRSEKLLFEFPDFLRITGGYLSVGIPFTKAMRKSIKYVGDEWKPILQQFILNCEAKSIEDALDTLRDDVGLFEVREFVALIRLTLERGGNPKDGFEEQSESIRDLKKEIIALKVNRRQLMATMLQLPLLLCNLLVFLLPLINSLTTLTTL